MASPGACPTPRRCVRRRCGRPTSAAGCDRSSRAHRGRCPGRSWAAGWFPGAGCAGHHDHLVGGDGLARLVAHLADRKIGISDGRHGCGPLSDQPLGDGDLPRDVTQRLGTQRWTQRPQPPVQSFPSRKGEGVESRAQLSHVSSGRLDTGIRIVGKRRSRAMTTWLIVGGLLLLAVGLVSSQLFRSGTGWRQPAIRIGAGRTRRPEHPGRGADWLNLTAVDRRAR